MNLRVRIVAGAALAVFLLVGLVLVTNAPSLAIAAILIVAFASFEALMIGLSGVIGRDAERHGRDGSVWRGLFLFSPVIFGVAYLVKRRQEPHTLYPSWTPDQQAGSTSIYRMHKWWPTQIKAMLALFAGLGVFLIWDSAVGATGPGWGFTAFWLFIVCYMAYGFLWRTAYELEIRDDALCWKTPLRSGQVPLHDIRELHPWAWGRNAEAIDFIDGHRILVMVQQGFTAFANDLATGAPGLPITVSRWASVADRWGGESGYRRGSGR